MVENIISIQLVDDHELVRSGVRSLIESTSDFRVVAESGSAEDAWRDYLQQKPDIVIMDISMPGVGGIEGISRILARDSDAKIIVLTMHGQEVAKHVIKVGAKGFVNKSDPPEMIVKAIKVVISNRIFVSDGSYSKGLYEEIPEAEPFRNLTKREFEIFMLLLKEKSNNEIADILGLSAKTVHVHKSRIFQKLGVSSMVGLTQLGITYKLI